MTERKGGDKMGYRGEKGKGRRGGMEERRGGGGVGGEGDEK